MTCESVTAPSSIPRSAVKLRLAIGILVILSAIGSWRLSHPAQERNPDFIVYTEQRCRGLKSNIPESGVVGYISDLDPDSLLGKGALSAMRYCVAPVQVFRDTDSLLVIGDFYKSVLPGIGHAGLTVQKDFGRGLVVLRRQ